ncbi:hypothetical protein ACPV5V_27120, partial [Vibrio campbellii]
IYLNSRDPISFNAIDLSANSGCVYDANGSIERCNFDPQLSFSELPATLPTFQVGIEVIECDDGCSRTIYPGKYDKITVGKNKSVVTLESGEYWISYLNMRDN